LNVKNYRRFAFFEIGKIFKKEIDKKTDLPLQPKRCSAIFLGYDFREAKGIVEAVLSSFNLLEETKYQTNMSTNLMQASAEIFCDDQLLGNIGELHPNITKLFGISSPCFSFEVDFTLLETLGKPKFYKAPAKYPVVRENISIFVPENKEFSDIQGVLTKTLGKNLHNFSVLEDTRINEQRSLLIEIEYFDPTKTLTTSEIKDLRENLIRKLEEMGVKPRVN